MAKVVSIEIGYSLIRLCEIDYKAKAPKVYKYVTMPTPPNVIEDGYVKESASLRSAIRDALSNNEIKTKKVIFTVNSSKIINREVTLPPIKEQMIPGMIKANVNDYFPINLGDHEIAHTVLEKIEQGPDAGKFRVMVMAVEKGLIKGYARLAESCGLTLVELDYVGNSVYQAVRKEANKSTIMLLKIEETQTTVTVVKKNSMMLQRSINYGIDEAIRSVMACPAFSFTATDHIQAWDLLKTRQCINVVLNDTTRIVERDMSRDESEEITKGKAMVTKSLGPLISSITRVIDFYNSRNQEPIDQISVIGMGADLQGITALLSNELSIPTKLFKRLEGIMWHQFAGDGELYNYVSCIGASIAPVSLISSDKKAAVKSQATSPLVIAVAGLFFAAASIALATISILNYKAAKDKETELQEKEALYLPYEAQFNKYNAVMAFADEMQMGYYQTMGANENILTFLEELENVLPDNIEVTAFASTNDAVDITMTVMDNGDISAKEVAAGIINNIRKFDSLQSVRVGTVTESQVFYEVEATTEEDVENTEGTPADDEEAEPIILFYNQISFTIKGVYVHPDYAALEQQ